MAWARALISSWRWGASPKNGAVSASLEHAYYHETDGYASFRIEADGSMATTIRSHQRTVGNHCFPTGTPLEQVVETVWPDLTRAVHESSWRHNYMVPALRCPHCDEVDELADEILNFDEMAPQWERNWEKFLIELEERGFVVILTQDIPPNPEYLRDTVRRKLVAAHPEQKLIMHLDSWGENPCTINSGRLYGSVKVKPGIDERSAQRVLMAAGQRSRNGRIAVELHVYNSSIFAQIELMTRRWDFVSWDDPDPWVNLQASEELKEGSNVDGVNETRRHFQQFLITAPAWVRNFIYTG